MSFKHYGKQQIGAWIDNNIEQAVYLHRLVENEKMFESATFPVMSAICIRFLSDEITEEQLKKLHFKVASEIEKEGKFWFATTEMKGKTWFRINPVNIHTTSHHMEELYGALKEKCRKEEGFMRRQS
jgi:glutamate/tyrosine decarboxylase-like PLP-dependent enzyme